MSIALLIDTNRLEDEEVGRYNINMESSDWTNFQDRFALKFERNDPTALLGLSMGIITDESPSLVGPSYVSLNTAGLAQNSNNVSWYNMSVQYSNVGNAGDETSVIDLSPADDQPEGETYCLFSVKELSRVPANQYTNGDNIYIEFGFDWANQRVLRRVNGTAFSIIKVSGLGASLAARSLKLRFRVADENGLRVNYSNSIWVNNDGVDIQGPVGRFVLCKVELEPEAESYLSTTDPDINYYSVFRGSPAIVETQVETPSLIMPNGGFGYRFFIDHSNGGHTNLISFVEKKHGLLITAASGRMVPEETNLRVDVIGSEMNGDDWWEDIGIADSHDRQIPSLLVPQASGVTFNTKPIFVAKAHSGNDWGEESQTSSLRDYVYFFSK